MTITAAPFCNAVNKSYYTLRMRFSEIHDDRGMMHDITTGWEGQESVFSPNFSYGAT